MAAFDWKKLSTADKVVAITALCALIAMFLPWYGASTAFYSASVSGFSSGYGWVGALLVVLAGVYLVLLRSGSDLPKVSVGPGVLVLGASVIGTLLVAIRWISMPRGSYGVSNVTVVSFGARVGIYVALVAGIVQVVFALRLFRSSGEALPWANK